MNKKIYINEISLNGQFNDIEEFLKQNKSFVETLVWLQKNNWIIYKKSNLYKCDITKKHTMYQLRGLKSTSHPEDRDWLLKYKRLLVSLEDNPPYWDLEGEILDGKYSLKNHDISSSSIAKACEDDRVVLSFYNKTFINKKLDVIKNFCENIDVFSVFSIKYMAEILYQEKEIKINEYINIRYKNTRLNFSKLEEGFGFEILERDEIGDYIESFDRFIGHKNWEDLNHDRSLNYKEYSPSKKDNWFRETEYKDKKIYKFRCGNPKRCFGYRKNNQFYVLRIERNHKISDKG